MAQLNEGSAATALFAASDPTPAPGFFEEYNLFTDDYMSVLFEDCAGFNEDLEMTAIGYSAALVKEDAQGSIAAALGVSSVKSFGAFDLELDLALAPTPTRQDLDPGTFEVSSGSAALPPAKAQRVVDECELRQPTKKKRKTVQISKHSSQRQREEIQSLRATAARLEQDLKRMSTVGNQQTPPMMIESMQLSASGEEAAVKKILLWECVAKRQEEAKQRAERENAELRNELQSKIKVAKSLEQRLLRKRKLREL